MFLSYICNYLSEQSDVQPRSTKQINKTNNHLSSQTIEHKKDNDICQWKSRSWLGTGTKNGSLKSVNEIPNPHPLE